MSAEVLKWKRMAAGHYEAEFRAGSMEIHREGKQWELWYFEGNAGFPLDTLDKLSEALKSGREHAEGWDAA